MPDHIVELLELNQRYDGKPVLNGLELRLAPGRRYALLGDHGSGKTTLLRILAGLQRGEGGSAALLGRPVSDPASRLETGFLVDEPALWRELSVANNLELQGRLLGKTDRKRMGKLMKALNILPRQTGNRRVGSCPASIRVRLGVAMALLGEPRLLLLDDPYSGLDSDDSAALTALLESETQRGMTTLLTGCFFAELWPVATDFLWLEGGVITMQASKAELLSRLPEEELRAAALEDWFQAIRKGEEA